MKRPRNKMRLALTLATGLLILNPALAGESALPESPEARSDTAESVQPEVEKETAQRSAEQRQKIIEGAVAALDETVNALKFLEEEKADEALAALERATGKLQLILARDPELALAPVDVDVVTYDLLAEEDTIRDLIREAREHFDKGRIQDARNLLENLGSEVVISTTNIPLATYPAAIAAVAPLIDDGKIEDAKVALESALNTLVITREIIPLPVLRAELLIDEAESLAEKENRSDEDNERLTSLLDEINNQLKLAQLLGYGDKDAYKPMTDEVKQIRRRINAGGTGEGWFDTLREKLAELI